MNFQITDKEPPNYFGIILNSQKQQSIKAIVSNYVFTSLFFTIIHTFIIISFLQYQISKSFDETERLTKELEVQKSLIQNEVELKKSINSIKKQLILYKNLPINCLYSKIRQKMNVKQLNQNLIELKKQFANFNLQLLGQNIKDNDISLKVEQNLKQEQSTLEQQNEAVENLVQTISKQKAQIEDLIKQQYEEMEKSEQQRITIQNQLTLTKLYEFCPNQIKQLNMNDNTQRISSESESSGKDDLYSDQEDSIITSNNFFQTQVQTSSQTRFTQRIPTPKKKKKEKKTLTYPQVMEKFQQSKELLSKLKNDVDINIMEQFILNYYQEQPEIQRQLADQHQVLQEQKDVSLVKFDR